MKTLSNYLIEGAAGKNLHLEHIEDEILNFGVPGGRGAINFVRALRDMLSGQASKAVNVSVKWDGAPAIIAGIDPADGKFFVGTKGVFAKTPKTIKGKTDISKHGYSGALAKKLELAFEHFQKLGIKSGAIQGDLMFTSGDLGSETFEGVNHITFQPNTIVYAVPDNGKLASQIRQAKIGIIWHTTYTGDSLAEMSASFGVNVSSLSKTSDVWFDDASYKDVSGKVLFTAKETAALNKNLSAAGKAFQKISSGKLKKFLTYQDTLPTSAKGSSFKSYRNTHVRAGANIGSSSSYVNNYYTHVENFWDAWVSAAKKEDTKKSRENAKKIHLKSIKATKKDLELLVDFQKSIIEAKLKIITKLSSGANQMRTFVKTSSGYKVTKDEGYVVVDRMAGNAIKLVDRLDFSHQNFTVMKNWDS
jgi:hypothetical protein